MTYRLRLSSAALALLVGCGSSDSGVNAALEGLAVTAVNPGTVVVGSVLVVDGRSFVSEEWGTSSVRLVGSMDGGQDVNLTLPARFVDFTRVAVDIDGETVAALGGSGTFSGNVHVAVESCSDYSLKLSACSDDPEVYESEGFAAELVVQAELTPSLTSVESGDLIYVNDKIAIIGDGLLLGGDEGQTFAVVQGCFDAGSTSDCVDIGMKLVAVVPDGPFERTAGTFAFEPGVAGIQPGAFSGTVELRNEHGSGSTVGGTGSADVDYELVPSQVFSVSPSEASLGQYVDFTGGGFVGGDAGGTTDLLLTNVTFTPADSQDATPLDDLLIIPAFAEGRTVQYVLNEDEDIGVDLRNEFGTLEGMVMPRISYGGDTVDGETTPFSFDIGPVKQVVHLVFSDTYVETLRKFGLRALDSRIRERILEVVTRDYATINLQARLERPTDFELYSTVEIQGPDPQGIGLLGYDNSPGKDTGNQRLTDRIGGVNAQTQEDGYPGYGGVFIQSLFAFSEHPNGLADPIAQAAPEFDATFDPFRPDQGGTPVSASDIGSQLATLTSGDGCPAEERTAQVQCAIWVLGSLIGTTLSHEIGHSLGLANPFGEGFHNPSDEENRLMDSGGDRPFNERAQLNGEGPGRFCRTEYEYLRDILPTSEPADPQQRPTCF